MRFEHKRRRRGLFRGFLSEILMLTELTISNFAIIERQSISFHAGFNVISGETGAGKSIILNALEFILGGKGSP